MNEEDIQSLGLVSGDLIDIESLWPDDNVRKVNNFKLVAYDIPEGNTAAYFPEANPLVPIDSVGDNSDTPTSKSVAIVVTKSTEVILAQH
jgi:anaerobic selenocysteine-containing dehydrogenase